MNIILCSSVWYSVFGIRVHVMSCVKRRHFVYTWNKYFIIIFFSGENFGIIICAQLFHQHITQRGVSIFYFDFSHIYMVLINSKVLKLIVTVSKPKLTSQFGLFAYCWSKQSQIISSGKKKKKWPEFDWFRSNTQFSVFPIHKNLLTNVVFRTFSELFSSWLLLTLYLSPSLSISINFVLFGNKIILIITNQSPISSQLKGNNQNKERTNQSIKNFCFHRPMAMTFRNPLNTTITTTKNEWQVKFIRYSKINFFWFIRHG